MLHVTILNGHFLGGAKLRLECNTAKHVKKEQRQVNKKFCELKEGNIGIVEKAQETIFGMSSKYSRYIGIALESCFVSYVIVKSPSKPYIVVHSHTALLHE